MKNLLQPKRWILKKQMDHEQTDSTKPTQVELQNFDTDSQISCEINNSISTSSPCNVSNKEDICLSSLSSLGSNVKVFRPNVAKGLNKDLYTLTEGKVIIEKAQGGRFLSNKN